MVSTSKQEAGPPRVTYRRLFGNLGKLLALTSIKLRRRLTLAIFFTVIATLADIGSLALLQRALSGPGLLPVAGSNTPFIAFVVAAIAGSLCRLIALRQTVTTQFGLTVEFAEIAFAKLQHQDYAEYLRNGGSQGIAAFERLQMLSFQALVPLITGLAATVSIALLLIGILLVEPWIGLAFVALSLAAMALSLATPENRDNALSGLATWRARLLHEARVGFRDIFLINGQERLITDFVAVDRELRKRQGAAAIATQSARHTLELAGLGIALLGLALLPTLGAERTDLVPMLGLVAFGGLRLLPHLAAIRSALRSITAHGEVTRDVVALLAPGGEPLAPQREVPPCAEVRLEHVTVKREGRAASLRDVSLTIPRGARIGICGASGAGKTTLLDVIAGALRPDKGTVLLDEVALDASSGHAWRERIGMVSQNPLLLGLTLRDVVIFPQRSEQADHERFCSAVALSGVDLMVAEFEHGLDTPVGEAIEYLSGGQRQRLALAHAVYRARDLLLLDEASGHLDSTNEDALIEALRALPADLSVILVSHRPALFAACDAVYELTGGRLTQRLPFPNPSARKPATSPA